MNKTPEYFLVSVSTRENLELCEKHALAGFTNSINGLWTFLDIDEGDFMSFLYGARVYNLYRVLRKEAFKNADRLPPWPPVTFKMSGKTYYFPFRLHLEQERVLNEPMVRPEFAYVAENLLLRGGYRKTHFQADTVTLYNVSNMGSRFEGENEPLHLVKEVFQPKIVFRKGKEDSERFRFHELVLQSLVRKKIRDGALSMILERFEVSHPPGEFEVLGEKALPEGFVDIFIKMKHPEGGNLYLVIEVKTGGARPQEAAQLESYINELGSECKGGVLIAKSFSKRTMADCKSKRILPVKYYFKNLDEEKEYAYEELLGSLRLEPTNLY